MIRHALSRFAAAALLAASWAAPAMSAEVVLVPSRVIYPGETVEADALKQVVLAEGKVAPDNVVVVLDALEGKVAKRTLLPGRYVQATALREAYVVEKGVPVEMVFMTGALSISASAVTLQPGSIGDVVKVRNIDSGKIVSGVVMADGRVRIGG
ncbi:flagellar basal body P-ring formation chaperone FlgA [Mesorhizobium sp. LHD-90]|uniref:flagellar basal body P-ring formation chaperone FlgA n=1 Tax=Mesorhizobium sp. LHD-90 TaxID=3071414 RepID=UPI0027E11E72|nr:flagellar basal body P-ring formation chaperone FlgA [Mesorhizobium sp. LHD-90]MDQ6433735.1 flagellar basal body P-ring formation chaperone FlgA [Mesorhizobium sp. LHD-90]